MLLITLEKTGGFFPLCSVEKVADEEYLNVDDSWQHMRRWKSIHCKTVLIVEPKICRMVQPALAGEWVRVCDVERVTCTNGTNHESAMRTNSWWRQR